MSGGCGLVGRFVVVDRDKNLLADPFRFKAWERFERLADKFGLKLEWAVGNDREGWRVTMVSPWEFQDGNLILR